MNGVPYNISCVLCGASVQRDRDFPNEPPEPPWMTKFRAVYYNVDDEERRAHLSGPGRRYITKDTVLARRPTDTDPSPREIWIDLIGSTKGRESNNGGGANDSDSPEAYGFPFHEACWVVLTKLWVIDDRNLQQLLHVLRSFETQINYFDTLLNWGHDYSGLAYDAVKENEVVPGDKFESYISFHRTPLHSYQTHNPLDCVELRRIFKQASNAVVTTAAPLVPTAGSHANKKESHASKTECPGSCFSALPAELLQQILECLPLSDALVLRLASRDFAKLGLHDLFWRSRFLRARELGFAFEAQPYFSSLKGQWKSLGRAVKSIQPPPTLFGPVRYLQPPPSLVNRVRIWGLAASLGDLVRKVGNSICHGRVVDLSFVPPSCRGVGPPQYDRTILIPDEVAAVFVSMIKIHGRGYVSGIRVQQKGNDGRSVCLGYQYPADETLLLDCVKHNVRWTGLHLACDKNGIRGLAAVTDSGALPVWVGEHDRLIKASIAPESWAQKEVRAVLRGVFDAVRLELLEVFVRPSADGSRMEMAEDSLRDSVLWYPHVPEPHLQFPAAKFMRRFGQWGTPVWLAIFGGSHGEDLNKVRGLRINQQGENIMNLEIVFCDDRTSLLLGRECLRANVGRVFFPVDGPGGERITNIQQRLNEKREFKITTNRGRAAVFPNCLDEKRRGGLEANVKGTVVGIRARVFKDSGIDNIGVVCI